MKKRIFAILVTLVLMLSMVAACGEGGGAARQPGDSARGVFITQDLSNASQNFSADEFRRLMGDYNIELTIAGGDVADNNRNIDLAIAEGWDVIFINPNDIEAVIPGLTRAREAGIIVGLFSSQPPSDDYPFDFFAGSDDLLGGIQAGEFVSSQFPNGANFVEVGGQAGHIAATKRHDGFRQGINANIIELDSQFVPGPWQTDEARTIMEGFLVAYDNIDIVWCHWDNGASGVIEAAQAAGRLDEIFIIGYDGNSTGYQQVKDGVQALSVGQSFTNMAAKCLELARKMLDGGTLSANEKMSWIPVDMVTLDSINDFPWPAW
ncbi:MAG: sugar ABC transporter substrate-binding protein [Oscillospiraceae bacterium]|nr:sugar ABC transporter substrate-binding protein [Oscillospiraceae bacterium]